MRRMVLAGMAVFMMAAPAQAKLYVIQQNFIQGWQFVSSSPQANESTQGPPKAITLAFSQAVKPGTVSIALYDPYNNQVALADVKIDGASVSAPLPPLKPGYAGVYRVEWKAQCQCDNPAVLSNRYYFNMQ